MFRDNESLSANAALWSSIEAALDGSRFFILLASPEAAQSRWVAREVEYWLQRNPPTTLLIALTGGEIRWDQAMGDFNWDATTALPPCLEGVFADEPRYIDLRWARTGEDVSLHQGAFRDSLAEFAAPLHGRPKDELAGEDVRQHRRTIRLARATVSALLVLTLVASFAAVEALQQRNDARRQRDEAISRELAASSLNQLAVDPELAVVNALQAIDRRRTAEAEAALRRAVSESRLRATLRDHNGPVHALAFSPDGRRVASGGEDGSVRMWELDRRTSTVLGRHDGEVHAVAFNPNGTHLATTGQDGVVRIWEVAHPNSVAVLSTGTGKAWDPQLHTVAFSPDGRHVAAAGDRTPGTQSQEVAIWIWDVSGGVTPRKLVGHEHIIYTLAFSPDGRHLASGSLDYTVRVWNFGSDAPAQVLPLSAGASGLDFTPDSSALVSTSEDGEVRLWTLDGASSSVVTRLTRFASDVDVSPDGQRLAVAGAERFVQVLDLGGREPMVLRGHEGRRFEGAVSGVEFSPDGSQHATAGDDGTVRIWDASGPSEQVLQERGAVVSSLAFSPDGKHLAGAGEDGNVRYWRVQGGDAVFVQAHDGGVDDVAFDPSGTRLATVGADATLRISDLSGGSALVLRMDSGSEDSRSAPMEDVAFAPDGTRVAAIANENREVSTLRVWHLEGSVALQVVPIHRQVLSDVEFGPLGEVAVAASSSHLIVLPDLAKEITRRFDDDGVATSVTWSSHAQRVATGDFDGDIHVWEVEGQQLPPRTLRVHEGEVNDLAFSPDGRSIASAGVDGSVRIWHPSENITPLTVGTHEGPVLAVAYDPNGRWIASAGADGTVRLWNCEACRPVTELIDLARTRITRPFPRASRE